MVPCFGVAYTEWVRTRVDMKNWREDDNLQEKPFDVFVMKASKQSEKLQTERRVAQNYQVEKDTDTGRKRAHNLLQRNKLPFV